MISRRPEPRLNRGRIATAASAPAPAVFGPNDPITSIVTSVAPFFYFVGDNGATGAQWNDQTGNARHATQATGADQPAVATDATFNNRQTVQFDGVSDFYTLTTWDPPAPGTTNIFMWAILKQKSWTSTDSWFGCALSALRVRQGGVSPAVAANNAIVSGDNVGAVLNTWTRMRLLWSGSVNDYFRLASTAVGPGASFGNTNSGVGTFQICADVSIHFGALDWYAFGAWAGEPNAGELAALDTWATGISGGVVAL